MCFRVHGFAFEESVPVPGVAVPIFCVRSWVQLADSKFQPEVEKQLIEDFRSREIERPHACLHLYI